MVDGYRRSVELRSKKDLYLVQRRSLKVIDVLVRKNGSQEEYDRCQNSETKVN